MTLVQPLITALQKSNAVAVVLILVGLAAVIAIATAVHEGREGAHAAVAVKAALGLVLTEIAGTFIATACGLF
jgi:hypothetical protein